MARVIKSMIVLFVMALLVTNVSYSAEKEV